MPLCAWLPGLSSAALPRAIDRALASVARIASARNDSGENGRDLNQPDMAQCRGAACQGQHRFRVRRSHRPRQGEPLRWIRCPMRSTCVCCPARATTIDGRSISSGFRPINRAARSRDGSADEPWEADAAGSAARFGSAAANDRGATTVHRDSRRRHRTPRRKETRPSSPCFSRNGSPDCGRRNLYAQSGRWRRTISPAPARSDG